MSQDQEGTKTVRVPVIVKVENIHKWLTSFMAFAVVERIIQACRTKAEPGLPSGAEETLDETETETSASSATAVFVVAVCAGV